MGHATSDRERIVVGIDGSAGADAALRWAMEEAGRRDGRLEAVIAWRPSAPIAPPARRPSARTRTLEERHCDAEAILERALRHADRRAEVEVEKRVMRGSPHRVLLDAAGGADLLVIGSGSGRGLGAEPPWSTAQHVVRDAICPVVVVPRRAQPAVGTGEDAAAVSRAAG